MDNLFYGAWLYGVTAREEHPASAAETRTSPATLAKAISGFRCPVFFELFWGFMLVCRAAENIPYKRRVIYIL